jgi:O-antigen/teichoic acid export membrane protein
MSIKRQTLWSLVPLLVTAGVGFFSLPMFINYLGADMYALWNYIISFSGMFGFADLGLGVVVGRYIGVALGKKDQAAVRAYWGTGNLILLPFLLLITLTAIGVGVWVGPHWYQVVPAQVGKLQACFVVGGCGLFLSYYGQYWLILSQAHLDFKFIGLVRVVMTLLQILPSVVIAWLTHNPLLLLAWSALVSLLQLAVFVWHARRHYQLGLNFRSASRARAREMAPYTGKMFAGLILGSFFSPIDRTILGKLALPQVFSPYVFAGNVAQRLQGLSVSVMAPVLFNTCRADDQGGPVSKPAARIYDETFAFMFEWYLLAAILLGVWHPVLLRLWLTHSPGGGGVAKGLALASWVGPLLTPLVAACCLTAMANISSSQLSSLNRLGATVWFSVAAGLLAIAGVWIGWQMAGVVGAAYGFLFSRIGLVAQDLYTIRLIQAGGWLDPRTWRQIGAQGLTAAVFALAYLAVPGDSYWLLIPAALHGGLVALWLLREPLKKFLADAGWFGSGLPVI